METTAAGEVLRQEAYRVRFERGEHGALGLLSRRPPDVRVAIVVDVLSFSTAVDVAVARGAHVFPSRFKSVAESAQIATMYDALLAVPRGERSDASPYTLSPSTLDALATGARLVLPSPNGARCVRAAYECRVPVVIVGCLRNASAVAKFARERAGEKGAIGVIAAGERWPDGTLRPAVEDDLGAGAILAALDMDAASSPEARYAANAFRTMRDALAGAVHECVTGRELAQAGYADDVVRALEVDVSTTVPVLREDGFIGSL
ncbi:MAG TPA: 2-phosphosulfolactate phosphatase [Candidatus Elarobacter sp.]|nr:2-phosphosulfolactate phosphatase [Candidatus Elarobacter sp.]HEV2738972.1 2-phosphosulfolactate phosphatase [Candidatus Elarobacter sp.]